MIQDSNTELGFPEGQFVGHGLSVTHAQILSEHWKNEHDWLAQQFVQNTIVPLYGGETAAVVTRVYGRACGVRENHLRRQQKYQESRTYQYSCIESGQPIEAQAQLEEIEEPFPPYTGREFLETNLISDHAYPEAFAQFLDLGLDPDIANTLAWGDNQFDLISSDINHPKRKAAFEVFDQLAESGYWDESERDYGDWGDWEVVKECDPPYVNSRSRAVGWLVVLISIGALLGAVIGWHFPIANNQLNSQAQCK